MCCTRRKLEMLSQENIFLFRLAIELREAHIQGKTAQLAAVCLDFSIILVKI